MTEPAFTLDNIFKLIEIVSILGGGFLIAFRLGRASEAVKASTERFEEGMKAQITRMDGLQEEIKTLSNVVTQVAVQNQRLDTQDLRLNEHTRLIEDLRRGEGMILPLSEAFQGRGRGPK